MATVQRVRCPNCGRWMNRTHERRAYSFDTDGETVSGVIRLRVLVCVCSARSHPPEAQEVITSAVAEAAWRHIAPRIERGAAAGVRSVLARRARSAMTVTWLFGYGFGFTLAAPTLPTSVKWPLLSLWLAGVWWFRWRVGRVLRGEDVRPAGGKGKETDGPTDTR